MTRTRTATRSSCRRSTSERSGWPPRSSRSVRVHSGVVDVHDFEYELPPEAIAQAPALERDAARLLLIDRARGALEDHVVRELPELLRPGDCVVVNDSRVI